MVKDGGPAFPNKQSVDYDIRCKCGAMVKFDSVTHPGMSLRDHFAAAALPAFIEWQSKDRREPGLEAAVQGAYAVADFMLAQRDK